MNPIQINITNPSQDTTVTFSESIEGKVVINIAIREGSLNDGMVRRAITVPKAQFKRISDLLV